VVANKAQSTAETGSGTIAKKRKSIGGVVPAKHETKSLH
jgi:hypothetical protein